MSQTPDAVARWWPNRWLRVGMVGTVVASIATNAALLPSLYAIPVPVALVLAVANAAAIPLSLRLPRPAVLLVALCTGATAQLGRAAADVHPWPVPVLTLVILAIVVTGLGVSRPWPLAAGALGLSTALAALVASPNLLVGTGAAAANLITTLSVGVLAISLGVLLRLWLVSRERVAAEERRAERESALRRIGQERARIARELHDVVAHSLSIISIQASTVQYRVPEVPDAVNAELDQISEAAREALVEMRSLLQVLRADDAGGDLTPQPMLHRIPELVEATRRGGQPITLSIDGNLGAEVAETTSASAFRIVQEGLSNAVRHAPGAEVDVQVSVGRVWVEVEVRNRLSSDAPVADGGGLGLLGMRERAGAAGGELSAERDGDEFVVRARLPVRRRARALEER